MLLLVLVTEAELREVNMVLKLVYNLRLTKYMVIDYKDFKYILFCACVFGSVVRGVTYFSNLRNFFLEILDEISFMERQTLGENLRKQTEILISQSATS